MCHLDSSFIKIPDGYINFLERQRGLVQWQVVLYHDLCSVGYQVFLHCSASVCQPTGMLSCMVTCSPAKREYSSCLH